jgi:hypothetical protein
MRRESGGARVYRSMVRILKCNMYVKGLHFIYRTCMYCVKDFYLEGMSSSNIEDANIILPFAS